MSQPSALLVTAPFGSYALGAIVTDPGLIAAILTGPDRLNVVAINLGGGGGGASPVETLSVGVTSAVTGMPLSISGAVANATPTALDYSTNGGATWTSVGNFVLGANGNWTGLGPIYTTAQAGSLIVRDDAAQSIVSAPASFFVTPPSSGTGTLALSDGSAINGVGTGLSAGSMGSPQRLAVQFGTLPNTVADGGALTTTQQTLAALATSTLSSSGGTLSGPLSFSGSGTLSSSAAIFLQPGSQLWLGAQAGTGAVYSATIGGVTSNPGTLATNKMWNNAGVVCLSSGAAAAPLPTFAPATLPSQPLADVAASSSIFSHNAGIVPQPPAMLAALRETDRRKLRGFNFGEVWQPSSFYDCWPSLQNYLLYAQLMYRAQSGTGLDNIAERNFVQVFLPAGNYYVSQPVVVPENVMMGGPGRIIPTPYVGAQSGTGTVSGAFDGNANPTANYMPCVVVVPRAHLGDLNMCVSFDGTYQHKTSGVCLGKNWQAVAGGTCTIANAGSGYAVGDIWVAANPSLATYSGFAVTVTAVNAQGGITAATIKLQGAYALPPTSYNGAPSLQQQQWTPGNGFSVFDPANPGAFLMNKAFRSDFATPSPGTGATITPPWVADFITGGNQYQCGAGVTAGTQAGRIQLTGSVPDNYNANYGPTFCVMFGASLEFEVDSIQGIGGHAGIWVRYAQDIRIGRMNMVNSNIFFWASGAGSVECANAVADTCGCIAVIDQSHGVRLHGRGFFEEGNIKPGCPAINPQGAAFLIGSVSSATYPVSCCDLKWTLPNMGGLPASTIASLKLTAPNTVAAPMAATAVLSYLNSSVIDLTVSNLSQYGGAPALLPTSGIYAIGYGVDPGNDLRGALDTVPTIDGVAPPAQIVKATSSQGIRCGVRVWDGLHQCWVGPGNVVEMFGSTAPVSGASGTAAGLATPGSTYVDTASGAGRRYVNTGTQSAPVWA